MYEKAFKGEITKLINRLKDIRDETFLGSEELDYIIKTVDALGFLARQCDIYGLLHETRRLQIMFYEYLNWRLLTHPFEEKEGIEKATKHIGEVTLISDKLMRTLAKFVNENCIISEKRQ